MTDLIKRNDALAAIDTFKRDFEQSWKVQFSADIAALPAINLADHIEELKLELDNELQYQVSMEYLYALDEEVISDLKKHIEELVKERDELGRRLNTALYGQPHFAWSIHEEAMADLRAKLAKAVEERDEYKAAAEICGKAARAMLAELENEQ